MLGTDAQPCPQATTVCDAAGPVLAAIVTDGRGLVCAMSSHLADLGLDASAGRIGRHWTELLPNFRRLPTHPGSGDDDFVVILESTRVAFRITRYPLTSDEEGGALLLLHPVEQPGADDGQAEHVAALSEVAADVAHEINNPLTTISGWIQIFVAEASADDPIREQFASIQEELDRISTIVDRLLDFAQVPSSDTELLDVNELVRSVASFLEYQMKNANVEVQTSLCPHPCAVEGNRSQLKQVFLNLLRNARQAMPEGGRLRLLTSRDDDRACAEVRFRDAGHGVPEEAVDRLFEPGFTTRADAGGRGLGLDISRKIVRKMRGELELESTSGEGSTFLIRLPLAGEA